MFVSPSICLVRFGQLLRYADKRIVDIMKVYIERNNLKIEFIYDTVKSVDFIHIYFCEATDSMQYCLPNTNQEVSNTNDFGSVSDSLGRLVAASPCTASVNKLETSLGTMMQLDKSVLAENTLTTMDRGNGAVIPPHLTQGRLIHFSADNNIDINDSTLDGKHTFHATQYAARQRGPSHDVVTLKSLTPAKHATLAVPEVMNTIFPATDTGVTTEPQFDNGIRVEWFKKKIKP